MVIMKIKGQISQTLTDSCTEIKKKTSKQRKTKINMHRTLNGKSVIVTTNNAVLCAKRTALTGSWIQRPFICRRREFDDTVVQSERFSAIKTGLIHHFLHLKMPVPSQEYDSCCQLVLCFVI